MVALYAFSSKQSKLNIFVDVASKKIERDNESELIALCFEK